ncbi:MAG: hypothetical protein ABUL44_00695 [Flavobacterium sp.]
MSVTKYGITEKKAAELAALSIEVDQARHQVEQLQAIVSSQNERSASFKVMQSAAEADCNIALNNKGAAEKLVQNVFDLHNELQVWLEEMNLANAKTETLSEQVNVCINKLIYAATLFNKLANMIVRKKELNPLIPGELISLLNEVGKDADNAVALTMVAFKVSLAAQVVNLQSQFEFSFAYNLSSDLYNAICGNEYLHNNASGLSGTLLINAMDEVFENTKLLYEKSINASESINQQLVRSISALNNANTKLSSLQAGLAAGNAAAMAS